MSQTHSSSWQRVLLPLIALGAMAASYAVFFLQRDTVYALGREDGLFEDLTAVFFFCASATFACAFWRSGANANDNTNTNGGAAASGGANANDNANTNGGAGASDASAAPRRRRNVWFLLLALLFFFGGGEEISWGQRIFGWDTPQAFEQANVQRETNIHNLNIFSRNDANWNGKTGAAEFLSAERLFSLFWLGFCIATPIAYACVPPLRRLLDRLRMPIVPLTLGVLFLVNYSLGEILKPHALRRALEWPLMEIKECLFSVLFLLIASYFVTRQARTRRAATPAILSNAPVTARPTSAAADEELAHVAV